jgi:hypothetical protein
VNFFCKRPATVALCIAIAIAGPAAEAAPRNEPSLLHTITLWLAANFDLVVSMDSPALVSVPDAELIAMRYGPGTAVRPGDVAAVYDDRGRTIYLSENWTGSTPAELSVLVHEMVHHLQSAAAMRFACPAEREVLAYRAQDAWLSLFGESLESAFDIDAATLLVGTVCTR